MQGHAAQRQVIAGVLATSGVRARTDAGRTWAAEGHGRRLIFCTRNRTDPISGFAKNGNAPDKYHSGELWSTSCCSHLTPGEDPVQAGETPPDGGNEDLGCPVVCGVLHVRGPFENGLTEHELDHSPGGGLGLAVGGYPSEDSGRDKGQVGSVHRLVSPGL